MLDLIPQDEGWLLPVDGQQVTRCCIDHQEVQILFENLVEIAISEPFTLVTSSGRRYVLNPAPSTNPVSLAPILHIMRQVIQDGTAFNDGRLELTFRDGSRMEVPSGTDFEAWTLAGPGGIDGLKVASIPGGELAIWSDRR